jgi:1-acyl-sn-glycerol-3-phosphate acyltransferase
VDTQGLAEGARWALGRLNCQVHEADRPQQLPTGVIYVANHPGLCDALALFDVLNDPSLRVLALDRPLLRDLPALHRTLFSLPLDGTGTTRVLKQAVSHLRSGGSLLTFPAGTIEPDPAWDHGRLQLEPWSRSPWILASQVPGCQVQPLMVSGVRQRRYLNPLVVRWRGADHRDWAAAVLQLAHMTLSRRAPVTRIAVRWGRSEPGGLSPKAGAATLRQEMLRLAALSRR